MSGKVLDAVETCARGAAVFGGVVAAIGMLGRPVQEWRAGPDEWVLLTPMLAVAGSLVVLLAVGVLVATDRGEWLRWPDDLDAESTRRLAESATLWVGTFVAGHEVSTVYQGDFGSLAGLAAVVAFVVGAPWVFAAVDRCILLWSTRDYRADAVDGDGGVRP